MPGRLSTRNSATARPSSRSSTSTLKNHSAASIELDEGPTTDLRTRISSIFGDAQRSTTGHRKLVVGLRKIHEACCYESAQPGKSEFEGYDESDFNQEIGRVVLRLLPVKKTENAADKVIKFFGAFLRHASDKDALLSEQDGGEGEAVETPTSRLASHIFQMLLPLLGAKEKMVRYRTTQVISFMVNCLDSLDDDYYHLVKAGLTKRMKDKEAMVRVQAALALGRLAGNEGDDEEEAQDESDDEEAAGLLAKLIESLQNDPSADVRRSLLLNLPLTPTTLPYLLERARDLDPATRRALYSRLLPALGDFRHLSLSMREKLLRWGLRDRDEHVRKATARLFRERWIEDCAGVRDAEGNRPAELPPPDIDALLELLERIDVVNSGIENGIALEAMREFWDGRPDYREAVNFDDAFWDGLTSESVFLVRSLNDFCQQDEDKYRSLLEEKMPEVTKLGFFLERYLNILAEKLRAISTSTHIEEEDTVEQEFIVEQLLHVAYTLDYSDEVGRRKMFSLLRESLAIAELPEEITKLSVDVLRLVCGKDAAGEREFCGIVLEAVAEVHDTIATDEASFNADEDESFHSAKSEMSTDTIVGPKASKPLLRANPEEDEERAIKEIMVNMKCLHIAQCMLQNVGENLKENVHLVTMLNNLVVPAVRSHEAPIRERGLLCLGLCCLLDKSLADENLTLFVHCFNKGHPALQVTSLHVLCDILSTHPTILSSTTNPDSSIQVHPQAKPVMKVFTKALKLAAAPEVQAVAVVSLCKLLLFRVLVDPDLLKSLVTLFFDPSTKENAAARQALSYFLPAFAHSRRENMELLASVAPGVMHSVVGFQDDLEEDEEAVPAVTVGTMLVEWTDVRRLVSLEEPIIHDFTSTPSATTIPNGDIHASLALALIERIQANTCTREERKALLLMLGKLHINSNSNLEKLRAVRDASEELSASNRLVPDATSRNSLAKLVTAVEKALAAHSEADESRFTRKKLKAVSEEIEDKDQEAADDTEKEESATRIAIKREPSVSFDVSGILGSSRVDDEGDTIMER